MATAELSRANFGSVTSGEGLVLVDFRAAWCGSCRMFGPVFERASERHAASEISSIPTLVVIREGTVLYALPGALPEQVLATDHPGARAGHGPSPGRSR